MLPGGATCFRRQASICELRQPPVDRKRVRLVEAGNPFPAGK